MNRPTENRMAANRMAANRLAIGLVVGAALLLASCGKKVMLTPGEGAALPPRPATAAAPPGAADLLATDTQERPTRFNELVVQSRELRSDRFDMPPPG